MNTYKVTWIGTETGEKVQAEDPWKAWEIFHARHPNFRDQDDEGPSYYVTIEDEFGNPLLEAGEDKAGRPYVHKHPDSV